MKTTSLALVLAVATVPLLGGSVASGAADKTANARGATEASETIDTSARKKVRRHRHVHRGYRTSYGYVQPYGRGYYRQGYYRGVRPGWGYGPDPGDNAWPPFHFKPYW
jgi:Ni/Co efflux regulator RcnB